MAHSDLILHCGGSAITRDALAVIEAPPATKTWHPVKHISVLEKVEELLDGAGYNIAREQLGVARDGHRFFAAIDLESKLADGVGLVLGLRNSTDQSFPYGLAGGSRTFVCDNLSLDGDWDELTITRKHTKFGEVRFAEALARGIDKLAQYQSLETNRVDYLRSVDINDERAYATILRAYKGSLLSNRVLPDVVKQWDTPDYDWGNKTLWRLYNAMNQPLQSKSVSNPQAFSYQTKQLMSLVLPKGSDGASEGLLSLDGPSSN